MKLPVETLPWIFAFFPAILECETPLQDPGHFLELLASSQARRLDDQRVSMSHFPGLRLSTSNPPCTPPTCSIDQAQPQGTGMFTRGFKLWCRWWTWEYLLPCSPIPWKRCTSNTLPVQSSGGKRWAPGGRWGLLRHACKMPGETPSWVIFLL